MSGSEKRDPKSVNEKRDPKVAKEERRKKLQTFHREHILKAAMSLVEKGGLESLTMEDVARIAGFSVGSLYNYFRNKDELAVQLFVQKTEEIQAVLNAVPPVGLNAYDVMVWYTVAVLRKIRESKGIMMNLLLRIHEAGSRVTGFDQTRLHGIGMWVEQEEHLGVFARRILDGQKLRVPVEDAGCAYGGLMRSFMGRSIVMECGKPVDDEALAKRIVDLLWRGIAAQDCGGC